jgi:predicted metalloprotease with PDZ domain
MGVMKKPAKDSSKALQFTVTLKKKTPSTRLGLDIDYTNLDTLDITKVKAGLVKQWNSRNPALALQAGDKIVAINGVNDFPDEMFEEISASETLTMVIQRQEKTTANIKKSTKSKKGTSVIAKQK